MFLQFVEQPQFHGPLKVRIVVGYREIFCLHPETEIMKVKLACSVGLVNHGLNNPSPCVDEPEKQKNRMR